ncbi:hypothetical protein [Paenibacillus sp. ICGEB2008]|uniref:hypothetical protein n=1 Tax=Paenibacillus sp. ICGEB2008 TaxID=996640 RepID=UPI0004748BE4|nr:hypothetical protein [Paenibacillus sp. ICGEB2008]KJD41833.1 hypothetical protein QD46_01425 [Paenibacillus polymyxa]KKD53655.1 hypothetical protein C400_14450 [Paenibacillus sp. ICGEB2008]
MTPYNLALPTCLNKEKILKPIGYMQIIWLVFSKRRSLKYEKRAEPHKMLALLIITTGCWDQDSLKDARLANASIYDLTPKGLLQQTLEVVDESQTNEGKVPMKFIQAPRILSDRCTGA